MTVDPLLPALLEEATKKSGLVWVAAPGDRPRPVWHLWHEGSAYVVTGGLEQPLPGLADGATVAVTVRSKDTGGRLVTWTAAVSALEPGSPEWAAVMPLLHAKRLNARDGEAQPDRWAAESQVLRLAPTGAVADDRADPTPTPAPPVPTSATSRVPLPFTLHRWWRERRSTGR